MYRKQEGQIIIISLVFMAIAMSLVSSLVLYSLGQVRAHRQGVAREKGLNIAEAGVEAAIWKLNNVSGYTGESNTSYGDGVYSIGITSLSGSSKLITVDAYVPNASSPLGRRRVQVTATIGTKNVAFNYGLQVGNGGLKMDNNTTVIGNVYADGNIVGSNNAAVITGDAIVAGGTGSISGVTINGNSASHSISTSTVSKNANHFHVDTTAITGDVSANDINSCTIGGNAAYNANTSCTVAGTITSPNNNVPADPATQPLPIDDQTITDWETEASNGGVIGSQSINGSVTLGPVKIAGDLTVNGTLTMTGTIWVTGSITLTNGSTVQLASSYGSLSGVLIAGTSGSTTAGFIDMQNGSAVKGSGNGGSYLMLLSERDTSSSATDVAINAANTSNGAILYAGSGMVDVVNRAALKEITAWKIHLNNNSSVTYETGLASSQFSSGPGGGWEVAEQTWQLLR